MDWRERIRATLWKFKSAPRAQLLLAGILLLVLLAFLGGLFLFRKNGESPQAGVVSPANTNTQAESEAYIRHTLTGVLTEARDANSFPIAVMIENHSVVRPQSGIEKAAVVYEALSEGGITRFLAVFPANVEVGEIGPVRSVRPYYLDWAEELGAMLVHAGGSPEALRQVRTRTSILDLDQFVNAPYFWRDRSRARELEHTLFTSSKLLSLALRDKGKEGAQGAFTPWVFKDDAPPQECSHQTVTIDFSTFRYKVEYRYECATNTYARSIAGAPHTTRAGVQLAAKNVVVQYTETRLADSERLAMQTVGGGKAVFFIDGQARTGTWRKDSSSSRTLYQYDDGSPVHFNAGTTWVEIVPTDRTVEY